MNELEAEIFGTLFGEGGDDDYDLDDIKLPDIDEDGDDDVDTLVNDILNGDSELPDDDTDTTDSDLAELEKEYNITAASEATDGLGADDDELSAIGESCCGSGVDENDCDAAVEPLDPETDAKGDRILAAIATPSLIENTLDDDDYTDFIESGDANIAADEGYIQESYIMEALEEFATGDGIFTEAARFAPEGKKYKMTKSARLRQLYEMSLQIEARLHKDPDYYKMQRVYAIRRKIRKKWRTRYHAQAMRRAKKYLKGLMHSKSNGIQKLATKLVGNKK